MSRIKGAFRVTEAQSWFARQVDFKQVKRALTYFRNQCEMGFAEGLTQEFSALGLPAIEALLQAEGLSQGSAT